MMRKIRLLTIISLALFIQTTMAQNYRSADEAQGLKAGSDAPYFEAKTAHGETYVLEQALKQGPVVIIFYRGHWCPICNKHLGKLQDSLELITEKGAQVVAVSPEKPELLNKTAEKTGAAFTLLYDEDYHIANAFDVTFRPDSMQRIMYNTMLGAKLKRAHSDDSQRLPIPATFVISKDGKIVWRQFDPDYKKRSSVEEILIVLSNMNRM
jgi:peroxiredoxin